MLRLPKVAMPVQTLLKRSNTCKAIVPYQSSIEKINPAFSDVPILHRAFNYLTTAPEIGHMDIIY